MMRITGFYLIERVTLDRKESQQQQENRKKRFYSPKG
jgi:hypothetical protein